MLLDDRKDYTYSEYLDGNTVLKPEIELPERGNDEYKELEKLKKESRKKEREKRIKSKTNTLKKITAIFVLGFILVYRAAIINDMQKNLNGMKGSIRSVVSENDALNIQLIKSHNLESIQSAATDKLKMQKPDKSLAIYTDLTKNFIKNEVKQPQKKFSTNIIRDALDSIIDFMF